MHSTAAEIIRLATDRLNSHEELQVYYECDDGIQLYPWSTPQEENKFRTDSLGVLRAIITKLDDTSRLKGKDPIIIKGEALARSMRVLQVVPFRSVAEIQQSSTEPDPAILFRADKG